MANKQIQEAGNNSQQLQSNNMIVNFGIDEKRAREIYQEMHMQLKKDYTQEALEIAESRVAEFENRLVSKMEAVDGALEAFADPSFQLLIVEAQKAAASSERPADYDLLSELLIHRFEKGDNRLIRAGISRAVEIVDQISDEALLGLTVFHSVSCFFPASGVIQEGLNTLNDLFGKLFYCSLPVGSEWLDHLDILDSIRITNFGSLKKIEQYYPYMLSGYIDNGIEKNSDVYDKAVELLSNYGLPQNILKDHELNNDFVRIIVTNKDHIKFMSLELPIVDNGKLSFLKIPLTDAQISIINSIYDMYSKDVNMRDRNVKAFIEEWDKQPNLKKLREWWDNINVNIKLTSVGKVLAHSNAQRCDKNLPPLN